MAGSFCSSKVLTTVVRMDPPLTFQRTKEPMISPRFGTMFRLDDLEPKHQTSRDPTIWTGGPPRSPRASAAVEVSVPKEPIEAGGKL